MKKRYYYPTQEEIEIATKAIAELCEIMEKMPTYELYTAKPLMAGLARTFPGFEELLELEPEEMVRRHTMGKEAAKELTLPVK